MARVWPDRVVEENNLAFHISALRKAFAADRSLIRTVSGRGYQFFAQNSKFPKAACSKPRDGAITARSSHSAGSVAGCLLVAGSLLCRNIKDCSRSG